MNKQLFANDRADTSNEAGGRAYSLSAEEALAQLACTSMLGDSFYTSAETQLEEIRTLADKCGDDFVAKCAAYARQAGQMKDTPAVLVAYLFGKNSPLVPSLFPRVIDNGRRLRNFVQAVRSGRFGRKSLGSQGKRLIGELLHAWGPEKVFRASVGNDPSMADVIRLARPRPRNETERELYAMLIGKTFNGEALPTLVQRYNTFRNLATLDPREFEAMTVPKVPFQMVDSLPLTKRHWRMLFQDGGYQFLRMNLNTAARHGLMEDDDFVQMVADRLRDPESVRASRQFPYQLLTSYMYAQDMPRLIVDALHDAMEVAVENVPLLDGNVIIAVDSSGSMGFPMSSRPGVSSPMCYSHVAGLFAAAIVRKNPGARVITFDTAAYFEDDLEPRDTVMTIAKRLSRNGWGTACAAPIAGMNREGWPCDLFIMISDNQSWADGDQTWGARTSSVEEWARLKKRCPQARQVRINIAPGCTDQLPKRADTLRVGGFSDAVFTAIENFSKNQDWTSTVESVEL